MEGTLNLDLPQHPKLSESELLRYGRQIKLAEFGLESQLKLKAAKALIVGAGGLGNPVGLYLAGAGIGTIGVADFDQVSLSNLHRQVAFETKDIGSPKADSLIATMCGINPELFYSVHDSRVDAANVEELISQYDIVIDGSDNFETRFLLGDACYFKRIALVHGSIHEFQAQIAMFDRHTACFRCLYREPPGAKALPPCDEAGILNVVTGVTGLIMATETVKYLVGLKTPSLGAVLAYDALAQSIRTASLTKDNDCPLCGRNPQITRVQESTVSCTSGADEVSEGDYSIEPAKAKQLIANGAFLLDVREPEEFESGHLENAISIPLGALKNGGGEMLPHDRTIVAYCKVGIRSERAAELLRARGFKKTYSIAGGLIAWFGQS
jgi:sulfur-carrier protein adenylyltransferase/sulfurtransferase